MAWERKFPFSNFQECEITFCGITYPTVENFYQAMKFDDIDLRQKISTMHPGSAKKFSRRYTPRPDWDEVRDRVMWTGLRRKFTHDSDYGRQLLSTPDELLIEDNMWHDNYWGSCRCPRCGDKGENKLGEMLRYLKSELAHQDEMVSV